MLRFPIGARELRVDLVDRVLDLGDEVGIGPDLVELGRRVGEDGRPLLQLGCDLPHLLDREAAVDDLQRVGVDGRRERVAGVGEVGAHRCERARRANVGREERYSEAGGRERRVELGAGVGERLRGLLERRLCVHGVAVAGGGERRRGLFASALHQIDGGVGGEREWGGGAHEPRHEQHDDDPRPRGQPACVLAFELGAAGFDPDDQEHDDRGDRGQPGRHDAAGGEDRDDREEELCRAQEEHGFDRRPTECDEAVQHVVVAVLHQRAVSAEAVLRDEHAVEREEREEDEGSGELAPRHCHRVDGERTDGEHEADAEATTTSDEQRRRPDVEGEEGEAGSHEPDEDRRQTVLVREGGDGEEPDPGGDGEAGSEPVGVAESVDRLHHDEDQQERTDGIEDVDPGGPQARAGHDGDECRGGGDPERETVGVT